MRRTVSNLTVSNAGWIAAGALTSGAASATALAVATRSLGVREAAPLAVAWTLAVVVGPGLWSSVELEVARQTASSSSASASPAPGLVVRRAAMASSVVAGAGLALRGRLFDGSVVVPLVLSALAAAYGSPGSRVPQIPARPSWHWRSCWPAPRAVAWKAVV